MYQSCKAILISRGITNASIVISKISNEKHFKFDLYIHADSSCLG